MQLRLDRSVLHQRGRGPQHAMPPSAGLTTTCLSRRAGRSTVVSAAAAPLRAATQSASPAAAGSAVQDPPAAAGVPAPGLTLPLQPATTALADVALPGGDALAPDSPVARTGTSAPVHVRFNGQWYDLTAWVRRHPAGSHWIERYHGRDATEVFTAFHSDHAAAILSRLPRVKSPEAVAALEAAAAPNSAPTSAFRRLRAQLVEEGWFKRDAWSEAWQLATWVFWLASGLAMSHSGVDALRALAFIPIGLSLADSCWLAHDYIHGRGPWCSAMRNFGGWSAGFSASMWSAKHNMHHAATNECDTDEDLSSGPLMWLWAPDPANDKPWRKFQHLYFPFLFSLLHVVWRLDSVITVARNRKIWVSEGLPIAAHYALAAALLPWQTYLAAILFGGFVVANVVTTTHQSEDLIEGQADDWVTAQFATTRSAVTRTPFTEWAWGGMQYQLEHHLFPTLPRYKYRKLVPVIKQWAAEVGLEYREADEWSMFSRNYANYKRVAAEPARPGAPGGAKGTTI